ncbi:hypothetical protein MIMGU_mgv11b019003mg [Erythranthe guttata]|uniref:Uncharacterized protein n=1 Tax=Erythranthe guttata TaxID=4155 RepID=A0A022RGK3_ERYGU|nr:hypothetical protein MIMGU_mgv11b019003mg [Erythranthe guttata]
MKIPATVRGQECASRNVHKNTRYKNTHISKSTKSCTKFLTQNCIRKKDHENTNYNPRTLIQINKHAQTHSLKWTCTNIHVKKHARKCIPNNVRKNTKYNTRTLMRITKQQQKHKIQKIRWSVEITLNVYVYVDFFMV